MLDTSVSLLEQIRVEPTDRAWQRLVELYTPLVRGWVRRHATLQEQDVEDLVQEVLTIVVRKLKDFDRQRTGSFRRWLKTIAIRCLHDHFRVRQKHPQGHGDSEFVQMLEQLEDPDSAWSQLWDREHDQHVTRQLLQMVRPRFEEKTWTAFQRVALEGATPEATAEELDVTVNAIFIAKSRVLAALRQVGKGLLD